MWVGVDACDRAALDHGPVAVRFGLDPEDRAGVESLGIGTPTTIGILEDQMGDGAGAGLLLESVLTFALVFVFFATAIDPRGNKTIAPLAIGLVVLTGHFVAAPLTGAAMNPALAFGPAVVANVWTDHWIYWLGPLIGAAIAGLVYQFVFLGGAEEESAATEAA